MDGLSPKRAKQLAIVVAIVVAVFVLVEAAVRARASVLPLPPRWVGPEMPLKERQVESLRRTGGASVMFIGSSVVDVSVDPSAMRSRPGGRPIYNASTGAASLGMISTWTRLFAEPRLRPDVVVLGMISREFNPHDPEQRRLNGLFAAAPAVRQLLGTESAVQKLERTVQRYSALVRYRSYVRQPKYLQALLGLKKVTSREYGSLVAPDGQYQGFLKREYPDSATVRRVFANNKALANYEVGGPQLRTFRELVTFLKGRAKRVVVVNMPVTSDYVDSHPRGEDDFRTYTDALERETERLDVELVDMGIWPAVYFADPAHLNARGSLRISEMLDDLVAEGASP